MIPYGHQLIEDDDVESVVKALRSDWLTQGPNVEKFEEALAQYCNARYAVVVSNGTAALHAAYYAIGLGQGNELITSSITFPATSNAALWQGAKPIFVDIDPETGTIDPAAIEEKISPSTKAIVPIDYTGRPADLRAIKEIAHRHKLAVIEDACQALGAAYYGSRIGSLSDLTVFSFHPVKSITTGEGGAILTNNEEWYKKMKRFITHGVTKKDFIQPAPGEWYFEMQDLGQNYRLTDFQSALGISQLKKLDTFIQRRKEIVSRYSEAFRDLENIILPLPDTATVQSAWHLYVIRMCGSLAGQRDRVFKDLRARGIGVQVHHMPVYLHPYYQKLGYKKGLCPEAEAFFELAISLPLFPGLSPSEQEHVIASVREVVTI